MIPGTQFFNNDADSTSTAQVKHRPALDTEIPKRVAQHRGLLLGTDKSSHGRLADLNNDVGGVMILEEFLELVGHNDAIVIDASRRSRG